MSETVCPLCRTPRPRGAKRCACNYTFEYDRLPADVGARRARSGDSSTTTGLAALAVVGGAAAAFFASGVERPPQDAVVPIVMIVAGAFAVLGALAGWRWFFASSRARVFVRLFGATGARAFYALLGGGLTGGGLGFLL